MDGSLVYPGSGPGGGPAHRAAQCLVAGCSCKDARIVSMRRARFFAHVARSRGQTADRVVPVDAEWAIPVVAVGRPAPFTALDRKA